MTHITGCVLRSVCLCVVLPAILDGRGRTDLALAERVLPTENSRKTIRPSGLAALAERVLPTVLPRRLWLPFRLPEAQVFRKRNVWPQQDIAEKMKQLAPHHAKPRLGMHDWRRQQADFEKVEFAGAREGGGLAMTPLVLEDLTNSTDLMVERVRRLIIAGAAFEYYDAAADVRGEPEVLPDVVELREIVLAVDSELRTWITSVGGWFEEAVGAFKQTVTEVRITVTAVAKAEARALLAEMPPLEHAMLYLDAIREVFAWVLYQESWQDRMECLRLLFRYHVKCRRVGALEMAGCVYTGTPEELTKFGVLDEQLDERLITRLYPRFLRWEEESVKKHQDLNTLRWLRQRLASGLSLWNETIADDFLGVARDAMIIKRAQEHFAMAVLFAMQRFQWLVGARSADPIAFYRAQLPRSRSENLEDASAFVYLLEYNE